MTDLVLIRGLRLHTVIGVYDWERQVRQELIVDLEMACSTAAAAHSDDVEEALDYARVAARVRDHAAASRVQLIEALAENIATLVQAEFAVPWLRVTLYKPGAVVDAGTVAVRIERGEPPP